MFGPVNAFTGPVLHSVEAVSFPWAQIAVSPSMPLVLADSRLLPVQTDKFSIGDLPTSDALGNPFMLSHLTMTYPTTRPANIS
jgi:hypothetical protein